MEGTPFVTKESTTDGRWVWIHTPDHRSVKLGPGDVVTITVKAYRGEDDLVHLGAPTMHRITRL